MPKLSIIVPVYKVEQYIHKCIDSILNQTFTDFELILVDDGSPDNCGKICDEYAQKDERVRVIHKKNGEEITSTTLHSKFLDSIPFEFEKCNFINCHASYVVNMNYVKSINDKSFVMKNDDVIPISKSMLTQVKKAYISYLVGD